MYDFNKISLNKILLFIIVISIFLAFFPYIKTEYLTSNFKDSLPYKELCFEINKNELKYYKVFELDLSANRGSILCIFKQSKNILINVEKQNSKWTIVYSFIMNKDNNLYWPFYI
jgi:hypothetical protein